MLRKIGLVSSSLLTLLLVTGAAFAGAPPTPNMCPVGGCGGGGGDGTPPPPRKPPPHVLSVTETHRTVRVARSRRVYGEVYDDLQVNGVSRARFTVFATYASRVWGMRVEAGPATAVCMWDGHAGFNTYAMSTVVATRNGVKTVNDAYWADSSKPSVLGSCAGQLGAALTAGGLSQSDLDYFKANVLARHPAPAPTGGGLHIVHFSAMRGASGNVVAGGSPDTNKAGWIGAISGGVAEITAVLGAVAGGTSAAPEVIVGCALGIGLATGLGAYEIFMLQGEPDRATDPELPPGGTDGVINSSGYDDNAPLQDGDGGAGPADTPPPAPAPTSSNDGSDNPFTPTDSTFPTLSDDGTATNDTSGDTTGGDTTGNDPGGSCGTPTATKGSSHSAWCEQSSFR